MGKSVMGSYNEGFPLTQMRQHVILMSAWSSLLVFDLEPCIPYPFLILTINPFEQNAVQSYHHGKRSL